MGGDTGEHVGRFWQREALTFLEPFLRIPNVSPAFDPDWAHRGFMGEAVELARRWSAERSVGGVEACVAWPANATPALVVRIAGSAPGRVLLYGHLDKQPPATGWDAGLGPWAPTLRDGRLYGRGSVDDGYALCAALGALDALQRQGRAHPACVLLLECGEESGSPDLPRHLDDSAETIGRPDLVVVLDSEAGDYTRLWTTTSLRGVVIGTLAVRLLREGVHSGAAGGIVASTFRIARRLLDRIEDPDSGRLTGSLEVPIPESARVAATSTAAVLGRTIVEKFPWAPGARPLTDDLPTLLLNNTWRGCLAVTGADGIPAAAAASNTQRPDTALKLSIRLPPTLDASGAARALTHELERDPPYGAEVEFRVESSANGWAAPPPPPWLVAGVQRASLAAFGHSAESLGTGGTIPLVELLGRRFPDAAFLVTGVAGPHSNAHGPNEFLHLPAARNLTACLAEILADAAGHLGRQP